jgi:hypothetical protein
MKRALLTMWVVSLMVGSASVLAAQVQIATLTTPANGATNISPIAVQFSWTSVSDEQTYYLYVGTALGLNNVVNTGETQATHWMATVSPNTRYYARMWTKVNGAWYYNDTTFNTVAGIAQLIAPANGATNIDPSLPVQFSWTSVPGEQCYYLYVGTTPGSNNIVNSGQTQQTTWTATLAPLTQYYVRIWTELGGAWYYNDSSFTTTVGIARLITPANGASGIDPTLPVQFTWNAVPSEQAYYLYVGTTPGSNNVVNSGETQQTSWTATLYANATFYARIWTKLNDHWQYSDSSFSTGTGIARLTTPRNGATGVSQFQLFQWNTVPDATLYVLIISPTNYETWDMYAEDLAPTVSSRYGWGLLPSTYYYASLCTYKVNGWACSNTNFTTGPAESLPDRQTFYNTVQGLTSQVRLMTYGMTNQAMPGTPLYQEALDHMHDPNNVDCGFYTITLVDQMTPNHILARVRNMTLDGTPDGHVVAEYWDPFNNKWQVADATFGLVYFDTQAEIGQGAEDINALLESGQLSGLHPLWVTNNGSQYMTRYYLDPITMYNNVYPYGNLNEKQLFYNYVPNSPLPFLNATTLGVVQGNHGTYVFQFAHQTDQLTINNAGTQVTVTPDNTYGWAPGVTLSSGWVVTSQVPSGMNTYTYKRIMF